MFAKQISANQPTKRPERKRNFARPKTGVASTSRASFKLLKDEGKIPLQMQEVYQFLALHGPANSRQIAKKTGLERTSVTRSLYDGTNSIKPVFRVFEEKACPFTGRLTRFYSVR